MHSTRGQVNRFARELLRLAPFPGKSCRPGLPVERRIFLRSSAHRINLALHLHSIALNEGEFIKAEEVISLEKLPLQRFSDRLFGLRETIEAHERETEGAVWRSCPAALGSSRSISRTSATACSNWPIEL